MGNRMIFTTLGYIYAKKSPSHFFSDLEITVPSRRRAKGRLTNKQAIGLLNFLSYN